MRYNTKCPENWRSSSRNDSQLVASPLFLPLVLILAALGDGLIEAVARLVGV